MAKTQLTLFQLTVWTVCLSLYFSVCLSLCLFVLMSISNTQSERKEGTRGDFPSSYFLLHISMWSTQLGPLSFVVSVARLSSFCPSPHTHTHSSNVACLLQFPLNNNHAAHFHFYVNSTYKWKLNWQTRSLPGQFNQPILAGR